MRGRSYVVAILVLGCALSTNKVRADLVAFDFSNSTSNGLSGYPGDPNPQHQDWGIEFTPMMDLMVTTLLIWDSGGDDFATLDGDVAIWDVSNQSTPIVSGAITSSFTYTAVPEPGAFWLVGLIAATSLLWSIRIPTLVRLTNARAADSVTRIVATQPELIRSEH